MKEALWAFAGAIALATAASYLDGDGTDCREYAKKQFGVKWKHRKAADLFFADHETLLSYPGYAETYKNCLRELT